MSMHNLAMMHPNANGTGSALTIEMHPAHGSVDGSIYLRLASQKTVGKYENGYRVLPLFDRENEIGVRLDLFEVAQMLEVFRGYRESMADGKGLFHKSAKANTITSFEHRIEPVSGYYLHVSYKEADDNPRRIGFFMTIAEALVISKAIAQSLMYLAFGVPAVADIAREEA